MLRSSTDLPEPEPPTMPNTSPSSTVRSRSRCTIWRPKVLVQAPYFDDCAHQMSIFMNSTANNASARITRKIASTTASVV